VEVVRLTGVGEQRGAARIAAAVGDPINVAYDAAWGRLVIYQQPGQRGVTVRGGAGGELDPGTLERHDARNWGVKDPQGLAVDGASGAVYVLDGAGPRLVVVEPGEDGGYAGARVSAVSLEGLGRVRGVALDPGTGRLHVHEVETGRLVEVTGAGQVVSHREVGGLGLVEVGALVMAPSGDQTDGEWVQSLYVADAGLGEGTIVELSLEEPPPAPRYLVSSLALATLVGTVNTWAWDPPSPDPVGVTYLGPQDRLLVADSEVNETTTYWGVNLFLATRSGSLTGTMSTVSFSDEPTGIDVDPATGRLFISDDTGTRSVYVLDPGPDGDYMTADDSLGAVRTATFGSLDPEGVAFATDGSGVLYIADGVNREVYAVDPGPNGVIDGLPPYGDDAVTSFDTLGFGLDDPEGIAYDPGTGNLLLVGKPRGVVFEVTSAGSVVRAIDISITGTRAATGLGVAPCSAREGMCLYVADRGVDNDADPNENDGRLFELDLGLVMPTPTPTPTATATIPPPSPTPTATVTPTIRPTSTPPPGSLNGHVLYLPSVVLAPAPAE